MAAVNVAQIPVLVTNVFLLKQLLCCLILIKRSVCPKKEDLLQGEWWIPNNKKKFVAFPNSFKGAAAARFIRIMTGRRNSAQVGRRTIFLPQPIAAATSRPKPQHIIKKFSACNMDWILLSLHNHCCCAWVAVTTLLLHLFSQQRSEALTSHILLPSFLYYTTFIFFIFPL